MNRWLSLCLLLLMLTLITSCTGTNSLPAQDESEHPAAPPRSKEVEEAYAKALEAFYWFEVTTMPTGSESKEVDGMIYYKVDHNTIKTYADLEKYLHTLFSPELVAGLLGEEGLQRYRDLDGALYAIPADRGTDIFKGEETLTVVQKSDGKITLTVQVDLLAEDDLTTVTGTETHEYSYELIDGQWVFTNFYLFR